MHFYSVVTMSLVGSNKITIFLVIKAYALDCLFSFLIILHSLHCTILSANIHFLVFVLSSLSGVLLTVYEEVHTRKGRQWKYVLSLAVLFDC